MSFHIVFCVYMGGVDGSARWLVAPLPFSRIFLLFTLSFCRFVSLLLLLLFWSHKVHEGSMYRKFEGEADRSHHGPAPNRLYSTAHNMRTWISEGRVRRGGGGGSGGSRPWVGEQLLGLFLH